MGTDVSDMQAHDQFAEFVRTRGAALQRTAYLLTGDWPLAEDLLQTALAKSFLRWRRIRSDDPEGYVRKVLVNTYATWWRRKWRGERPAGDLPDQAGPDQFSTVDDRSVLADALAAPPPTAKGA
jgi:DNA-directed RNA polymerase specialized sigma24 family protein